MTAAATDLSELSEGDLLDELEVLHRHQLETGAQLLLVAEFARQHSEATVDPVGWSAPVFVVVIAGFALGSW